MCFEGRYGSTYVSMSVLELMGSDILVCSPVENMEYKPYSNACTKASSISEVAIGGSCASTTGTCSSLTSTS